MFGMGMQELLVIFGIALLLFGGKRLPEIGKGLGKSIASFKQGLSSAVVKEEVDHEKNV